MMSSSPINYPSQKKISFPNLNKTLDFYPNTFNNASINNNNNINNNGNNDAISFSYPNKTDGWKPQMFLPNEPIEETENDGILRDFCIYFVFLGNITPKSVKIDIKSVSVINETDINECDYNNNLPPPYQLQENPYGIMKREMAEKSRFVGNFNREIPEKVMKIHIFL